jgi:hypothetical protein
MSETSLLDLELHTLIDREVWLSDLDIAIVGIELALEELPMLRLHLEKEANPSRDMDHEKPKNRSLVSPVEKSNMSIMERIMKGWEHLASDEDSLLVRTIYSNFEGDEWGVRQRRKTKTKNRIYCMYFSEKIQLYI